MREAKRNQNLVPKDMGNGSTQPSKTKLALKKRQKTGSTPLAKPKYQSQLSKLRKPVETLGELKRYQLKPLTSHKAQEATETCQHQQHNLDPPEEAKAQHI